MPTRPDASSYPLSCPIHCPTFPLCSQTSLQFLKSLPSFMSLCCSLRLEWPPPLVSSTAVRLRPGIASSRKPFQTPSTHPCCQRQSKDTKGTPCVMRDGVTEGHTCPLLAAPPVLLQMKLSFPVVSTGLSFNSHHAPTSYLHLAYIPWT